MIIGRGLSFFGAPRLTRRQDAAALRAPARTVATDPTRVAFVRSAKEAMDAQLLDLAESRGGVQLSSRKLRDLRRIKILQARSRTIVRPPSTFSRGDADLLREARRDGGGRDPSVGHLTAGVDIEFSTVAGSRKGRVDHHGRASSSTRLDFIPSGNWPGPRGFSKTFGRCSISWRFLRRRTGPWTAPRARCKNK